MIKSDPIPFYMKLSQKKHGMSEVNQKHFESECVVTSKSCNIFCN